MLEFCSQQCSNRNPTKRYDGGCIVVDGLYIKLSNCQWLPIYPGEDVGHFALINYKKYPIIKINKHVFLRA